MILRQVKGLDGQGYHEYGALYLSLSSKDTMNDMVLLYLSLSRGYHV